MLDCKKHTHECYDCIREEIIKLKAKLLALEAKLPRQDVVIVPYIAEKQITPYFPREVWYNTGGDSISATYTTTVPKYELA